MRVPGLDTEMLAAGEDELGEVSADVQWILMSVYERQSAADRAIGIIRWEIQKSYGTDDPFRGGGIVGAMLPVCIRSKMRTFFVKRRMSALQFFSAEIKPIEKPISRLVEAESDLSRVVVIDDSEEALILSDRYFIYRLSVHEYF